MSSTHMTRARILIADDHPLTLEGIRTVLEHDHEIVGTVNNGRALIEAARRLKPDLIVLDISMPLLNGIDAAMQIGKILPKTKFVFVTMHLSPPYLEAALDAGATGYVLKSSARDELLEAVASVLNGALYVSPRFAGESPVLRDLARSGNSVRLSMREREILQLIAEGKMAKEIAFLLHISVKTVSFHRENIKNKLGIRSTAELTKYAIAQRLTAI